MQPMGTECALVLESDPLESSDFPDKSPPLRSLHVRIEPARGWAPLNIGELWRYRELLWFMAWRDITIRYKQTVLGVLWAILQPLMTMVVFSLIFGKLAKMPSDNVPYPIFNFAGLVPWTFFEFGLTQSSNSLVSSSNLIKKVFFPRLAIPIAAVLSGVPDCLVAFGILLGMMWYYAVPLTFQMLWIIPLLLLATSAALGAGLWLSALNVWYRDVRFIVPFVIRFWLFATPVLYPSSLAPERWRWLFALNPMAGVIEGFRWAVLGTNTNPGLMIAVSTAVSFVILLSGAYYFRRMEKGFADVV